MLDKAIDVYRAVNWNDVPDPLDRTVWNAQWTNQWLPEKVLIAKDLPSWNRLADYQRALLTRVFTGLNTLDTLQYEHGVPSITRAATSAHEAAVNSLIGCMEAVHAKSYSYVFMTLCSTALIDAAYEWADNQIHLQKKVALIKQAYEMENPHKSTIASVLLEGFLFYSGFYYPLYLVSRGQMTNTADMIKLIIR